MPTKLEIANSKSLVDLLIKDGFKPFYKGDKVWFLSPLHNERSPSFCVDRESGKWQDFGLFPSSDPYKSNIDFIELFKNVTKSEAIKILLEEDIELHAPTERDPRPYYEIASVDEITSGTLIRYIKSRRISVEMAKKYCVQLMVKWPRSANPDKPFKLIGFKNNDGGYEVRMEYSFANIKSTLTPNSITTIKGGNRELIFEGFFNFLSYLTIFGDTDRTVYVLNSAGNFKHVPVLINSEYWGDNGSYYNKAKRRWVYPGDELLKNLKGRVDDMRYRYRPFEDLNDYLCKRY